MTDAVLVVEDALDDGILIDVFEDVGGVDEDGYGTKDDDREEDVQEQTIDHQRHVSPVAHYLPVIVVCL